MHPLLPWYVASSLVVCGYSSLLNGKYRSVNVYPSFENWKSSLYRNKTFENIAGKNPAGKISIMLHIDNLSRSNSSIKRKRGWIGLSYIIFWCGDTDISQRIFKLSGFTKPIKSITLTWSLIILDMNFLEWGIEDTITLGDLNYLL